jgi:hypothetical protein
MYPARSLPRQLLLLTVVLIPPSLAADSVHQAKRTASEPSGCPCDADLNYDGMVSEADITLMERCLEGEPPPGGTLEDCDVNCDGVINNCDMEAVRCQFEGLPGCCEPCDIDVNNDGFVDAQDLVLLRECFEPPPGGPPDYCDVNCDGTIDDCDLKAVECRLDGGGAECCGPGACEAANVAEPDGAPSRVTLSGSSPNPFTASTRLDYTLLAHEPVTLVIYDARGERVATLVDRVHGPGRFSVTWGGRDGSGERVPAGVYFAKLATRGELRSSKVVVIR